MLNNHQFNAFQYNLDGVSYPFPFPIVSVAWEQESLSTNTEWLPADEPETP